MRALRGLVLFLFSALGVASPVVYAQTSPAPPLATEPVLEVVSFGVAPVRMPDSEARPKPGDIVYRPEPLSSVSREEYETRALSGESWAALFRRVEDKIDLKIIRSPGAASRMDLLPALQPGKYVRLRSAREAAALEIDYVVTPDQTYSITIAADGIQVRPRASDPRITEKIRADPSKASLFTAADAIGLPEGIVLQLAEIFSDDVDFHRELHYGYRCTLVYEVRYRDGYIEPGGRVLAAEFLIRNRRFEAYYFDDGREREGYFTAAGKSTKKAFRRSPVQFSRITSEYTLARFHPVLGLWRAHRGIDYAAPLGSPVLATADGIVDFIGERGELGNLVILRHYGRFLTYYGHLSAFAHNVAVGNKVRKGDIIGRVGMTGLATGPHVHYEFRIDDGTGHGQGIRVPPPVVLEEPPLQTEAFFRAVDGYRAKFQAVRQAHVIVLD